ncbi:MAG: HAMP domain-containing sensor histidine kinase [Nannocystaceae bacterium]
MTGPADNFRAPIQFTFLWIVSAVVSLFLVTGSQQYSDTIERRRDQALAQQAHADAMARRASRSLRLAFALRDATMATEVGSSLIQAEGQIVGLGMTFAQGETIRMDEHPDAATIGRARVEHFTTRADQLLLGDWPLQAIRGTGEYLGQIEVITVDPALVSATTAGRGRSRFLFWGVFATSIVLIIASSLFLRRRLMRLAQVAARVASGQFEGAGAIRGADEFAWIGHQLRDIETFTREQVDRVHDRNADLLRDVAVQDERIKRMARFTTTLITPIDSQGTLEPVLQGLVDEAGAELGLLLGLDSEHGWKSLAATGLGAAPSDLDASRIANAIGAGSEPAGGLTVLPTIGPEHPWMGLTSRRIPLAGVVAVPLMFGRRTQGVVVLAAHEVFGTEDLGFVRDAAVALAIALANRHAYAETVALAGVLELRNEELLKQRDELRVVDRLRQEFVANMSHELRTPLNAITCYSELLADGMYGEVNREQRNACEGIEQASAHLLELVNQVLDLSRVDSGHLHLTAATCDLRSILDETLLVAKAVCRDRPYTPTAFGPQHEIVTDPRRVYQIVTNLLNNAIKFTERGSVSVELRPLPDGGARIDVKDTGIGIDEMHVDLIFEEFRQVDGSSTRAHDGVGLGLAISRRLAHALGGDLQVRSQAGQGSTFSLSLPARIPTETQVNPSHPTGNHAPRPLSIAS